MVFFTSRGLATSGANIGDIDVGTEILLNENGSPVNYLIVNQGIPSSSSLYDASCEGTWLLRKTIPLTRKWNGTDVNDYANSTINAYLNGDWLSRYDPEVAEAIKQVKIPYRPGSGSSAFDIDDGANGLPTKAFLLSAEEVGFDHRYMPVNEGAKLSYFEGTSSVTAEPKRIAYMNNSAIEWWLRTPYCYLYTDETTSYLGDTDGSFTSGTCSESHGVRPCIILPFNFKLTDDQIVGVF